MRAIIRFGPTHVSVLCPIGHLLTGHALDHSLAGSQFEAELSAHAAAEHNMFDRMAVKCRGTGHAIAKTKGE